MGRSLSSGGGDDLGIRFSQERPASLGDDDEDEDATGNAFTFDLLNKLRDSLVTYDNSLKGFLDNSSLFQEEEDQPTTEDVLAKEREEMEAKLEELRKTSLLELETAKEEVTTKFENQLDQVRSEAAQAQGELVRKDSILSEEKLSLEAQKTQVGKMKADLASQSKKIASLQK